MRGWAGSAKGLAQRLPGGAGMDAPAGSLCEVGLCDVKGGGGGQMAPSGALARSDWAEASSGIVWLLNSASTRRV